MIATLCAVLTGAMFYLWQVSDGVWVLAWLAPAPLLWLAYGRVPWWHLVLASLGAIGIGELYLFALYGASVPAFLVIRIVLPLLVTFPIAILLARAARRHLQPLAVLLGFPAFWVSADYFISLLSTDGSIRSMAYSQVQIPILLQSASVFGIWGITFLLCFVANGVALVLRDRSHAALLGGITISVFLANVVFGAIRLDAPQGRTVRVGLAAEDVPLNSPVPDGRERALAITYAYSQSVRYLAAQGATAVVLPEIMAVLAPAWRAIALAPLASAAREAHVSIIAGFVDVQAPRSYNVALSFEPDGTQSRYIKRHPLAPLDASIPGTQSGLLGNGRAVAICKDLDFPATIRGDAQHDIDLMLVPAADFNADGWMHARMAIMRGVENGFAVARAARNGVLTVSDDRGRVLASKPSGTYGIASMVASVPLGSGHSIYVRIGDVFAWMSVALTGSLCAYLSSRQGRSGRKGAIQHGHH